MALKTYHGGCHCGAVRYEADIDFSKGTLKCNCSICTKTRNWSVGLKPDQFRLLTDKGAVTDYQWNSRQGHAVFCSTCGVRSYSFGHIPELGGDYVSVQVACLDDATPDEILSGPITLRRRPQQQLVASPRRNAPPLSARRRDSVRP